MPLYEYRCEEDGSLVTLLRSMAEADEPVEDPEGLDRTFHRVHSTFQVDAPTASQGINAPSSSGCGCCGGGSCSN
ncbi:MAG: FmdB family transcriptional regulator [Phycisphaerae bacterium]|nr:FmdB family transcriptional regulator [Phycisphaerae bacterium]